MAPKNDVLYKTARPTKLGEVVGQSSAVDIIRGYGRRKQVPRCILFHGPSGCGKTTLARILAKLIKCDPSQITEMNIANHTGVDAVRNLDNTCRLKPLAGKVRVYILDECHQWTRPAQQAILKLLEDTPDHVYFMLCTTEPNKLLKTIHTRADTIVLQPVPETVLEDYVGKLAAEHGLEIHDDVPAAIAEAAFGSVREAVKLLDQVASIAVEKQIKAIADADADKATKTLVQLLMDVKTKWPAVAKVLRETKEEPERIRRGVMGYANAVILKRANNRAALILEEFQHNTYDNGMPAITLAAWRVIHPPDGD